jgi:hypothetical protein
MVRVAPVPVIETMRGLGWLALGAIPPPTPSRRMPRPPLPEIELPRI